MAVAVGGEVLLGRWALDLTEGLVPVQVWHAVADLPASQAEAVVRRATDTVREVAVRRLRDVVAEIGAADIVGVVVGDFPVPESTRAVLASHTLMHAAEGQLYRDALLDAAASLGIPGVGVPRKQAAARLAADLADPVRALGVTAGRPWRKEHKLAAVAALLAAE